MPEECASQKQLDLKCCKIKEILLTDSVRKKIVLLVESESDVGIVIIEKEEFAAAEFSEDNEDESSKSFLKRLIIVEEKLKNDIYFDCTALNDACFNREWQCLIL